MDDENILRNPDLGNDYHQRLYLHLGHPELVD